MDDLDGFRRFYDAHRREVGAAVALSLGDSQLAAEAVDEAFVRAAERWPQVRSMDRPAGWVYRVAVNWAQSWRRKWSLRPTRPVEQLDRGQHDVLPDPDLAAQLSRLPRLQAQMLVLRFALGCSVAETAELLGVAQGTVKSGVHRARLQLREYEEVRDGCR